MRTLTVAGLTWKYAINQKFTTLIGPSNKQYRVANINISSSRITPSALKEYIIRTSIY